jgi:hypothetical protein
LAEILSNRPFCSRKNEQIAQNTFTRKNDRFDTKKASKTQINRDLISDVAQPWNILLGFFLVRANDFCYGTLDDILA